MEQEAISQSVKYVGLDVHNDTIAVLVPTPGNWQNEANNPKAGSSFTGQDGRFSLAGGGSGRKF